MKATENMNVTDWMKWLNLFECHNYKLCQEEALALRDAIIQHEMVAEHFFYRTLRPLVAGLVQKVNEDSVVPISEYEVATIIYEGFYADGKWNRLVYYKGECSIFSWMRLIASQILFKELEREGIIEPYSDEKRKSTLTLDLIKERDELQQIIDLVEDEESHFLLEKIYVDRMPKDVVRNLTGMKEKRFRHECMVAEKKLKEKLQEENVLLWKRENGEVVNLVKLAMCNPEVITVENIEDANLQIEKKMAKENDLGLIGETLEHYYPGKPACEQWDLYILDCAKRMPWSDEDRETWYCRFVKNESPVKLAERLGRDRTWVDNKYSRLNKSLIGYIRGQFHLAC